MHAAVIGVAVAVIASVILAGLRGVASIVGNRRHRASPAPSPPPSGPAGIRLNNIEDADVENNTVIGIPLMDARNIRRLRARGNRNYMAAPDDAAPDDAEGPV
jgi:hypothetical protein